MKWKKFGEKVVRLAESRGWTQADLTRAVRGLSTAKKKISPNTVSRWWNGAVAPFNEHAIPLARTLGVPLDYLADDAQDAPPAELADAEKRLLALASDIGVEAAFIWLARHPAVGALLEELPDASLGRLGIPPDRPPAKRKRNG